MDEQISGAVYFLQAQTDRQMYLHCCISGAGNLYSLPPPGRQTNRCTYIAVDLVQVIPAVSLLRADRQTDILTLL